MGTRRYARLLTDVREWRPRRKLVAKAALVISTAVWATMFPVTEALLVGWDPYLLTAGRLGPAAVILLCVHCLREPLALLPRTHSRRSDLSMRALDVWVGSQAVIRRHHQEGLFPKVKQTKSAQKRTWSLNVRCWG